MAIYALALVAALAAGLAASAALRSRYTDKAAEEYARQLRIAERGRAEKDGEGAVQRLSEAVGRLVPLAKGDADEYRTRLLRAGVKADPDAWHGTEVLGAAALAVVGMLVGASYDGAAPTAAGLALGAAAGWGMPRLYLRSATKARRSRIEADLPDVLDLLAINVQAGSTLSRGIKQISLRFKGPLAEEFAQVDRDVNLFNMSMGDAVQRMARRCGSPQVSVFCSALTQSVRQGANIEPTLKSQAEIARKQRVDATEEKIGRLAVHATPVMLLFVLASLAAALVPIVYALIGNLGTAMGAM